MNTEFIIYRQQLLANPKFKNINEYGWETTGNWVGVDGHITKTSGTVGTVYQTSLLIPGLTYKLRFRMYGRTAGTLKVQNVTSGTVHLSTTANQIHVVTFTADGTDLIFDVTNTFDGTISQATLVQTPERFSLEIPEDTVIPMNFSIDDIFEVSKRKAPGSKTITFPGTNRNNIAFNQVYKIISESQFKANLKSRLIIKQKGITVFDWDLCLDDIEKQYINWTPKIEYKTQAIGKVVSIIDLLGNYTIKDLDFSEYDHQYHLLHIYNSWNDDIVINGSPANQNTTSSYTSPAISSFTTVTIDGFKHPKITFGAAHNLSAGDEIYVPDGTDFSFDQTVLSVPSATEIVLKCTSQSNFTGSLSGNVTDQQLAGFGYWYPVCDYGTVHNPIASIGPGNFDPGDVVLIYDYNAPDDFTNIGGTNATGTLFTVTGTGIPNAWIAGSRLIKYNTSEQLVPHEGNELGFTTRNQFWYADDFITHIFLKEVFQKMMALIGIEYELPFEDEKWWGRIIMPCDQSKFEYNSDTGFRIEENDVIHMNDILPTTRLADIFKDVIKIGNLGVVQDSDVPTKVRFVKRKTFFDNTPINWTSKLDASRPLSVNFLNKDLPKTYHLKYKDSEDAYNTIYNTEFGNISPTLANPNPIDRKYGDEYLSTVSDFLKSENKVELTFEPTVLGFNKLNNLVNSKCFFDTGDTYLLSATLEPVVERRPSNRLLFAGKRASIWTSGSYTTFSLITAVPGNVGQMRLGLNHHAYAGHIANIDDIYPDWDLNWGTPLGTYLSDATSPIVEPLPGAYLDIEDEDWGRNNLYRKNWKRFIESITDPNSRMVSGYFKLSLLDIYNLDFSVPVRVNDFVMKLNKVIDWDMNGTGICKVEFLLKQ